MNTIPSIGIGKGGLRNSTPPSPKIYYPTSLRCPRAVLIARIPSKPLSHWFDRTCFHLPQHIARHKCTKTITPPWMLCWVSIRFVTWNTDAFKDIHLPGQTQNPNPQCGSPTLRELIEIRVERLTKVSPECSSKILWDEVVEIAMLLGHRSLVIFMVKEPWRWEKLARTLVDDGEVPSISMNFRNLSR